MINKLFTLFKPKNNKFHVLFVQLSEHIVEAAKSLSILLKTKDTSLHLEIINKIQMLEHAGDGITHQIFKELSKNFITPFDREDIHLLASSLDDVLDFINAASQRVRIMKIKEFTPAMIELGDLIEESSLQVHKATQELKKLNYDGIFDILVKIHSIENLADESFDRSISNLFENEKDAITIIKHQQMLDLLETTTDKCEEVANAIESVALKYS